MSIRDAEYMALNATHAVAIDIPGRPGGSRGPGAAVEELAKLLLGHLLLVLLQLQLVVLALVAESGQLLALVVAGQGVEEERVVVEFVLLVVVVTVALVIVEVNGGGAAGHGDAVAFVPLGRGPRQAEVKHVCEYIVCLYST
jgi:hypothetical protein